MSEKVKVSREIGEVLKTILPNGNINGIIRAHVNKTFSEDRKLIYTLSTEEFAKCCIIGYEIEQTPEEELLLEYKKLQQEVESSWHPATKERLNFGLSCIRTTLDIQGVKIEGINK